MKKGKTKHFVVSNYKETTNTCDSNQQLVRNLITCCLELTGFFVRSLSELLVRSYEIIASIAEDGVRCAVKC